ncbi:hypothetical protein DFH09DRAFT_1311690 [Mycena vulgaris]|nr:hypothetical protein DFH09DRAFT_1311690 [Mycena vulgaris]
MFIFPAHAQVLPAAPARLKLFPAATLALTSSPRSSCSPFAKAIQVQVQEKSTPKSAPKPASSWLPLRLSWETLPPPPASSASSHVSRAGPVRHPEPALATRPRVEAPLPAIYESHTPVSMAKMIMTRHVRIIFAFSLLYFILFSSAAPAVLFCSTSCYDPTLVSSQQTCRRPSPSPSRVSSSSRRTRTPPARVSV